MAWNGSDGSIGTRGNSGRSVKSTSPAYKVRGAVAALIVCAVAVGAYFWITSGQEESKTTVDVVKKAVIAEVKPAITSTPVIAEKPKVEKPKKDELPPLKPGERRRVHWVRPANWDQMSPAEKTLCQPVARVIKPTGWDTRNRLFTEMSDKAFERLLSVRPGQMLIGTPNYGETFMKSFLKSLNTPIVINDDDSPEDKAMKQSVIDCRNDLKAAWDRGEDICEVMRNAEKEIREQATYRCNLRNELTKLRCEGKASENEYQDFCEAADKMLEEKGLEPLKMGRLVYRKAQYDNQVDTIQKGE